MEPGAVNPQRAAAHGHPLDGHAAHMGKFLSPFRRMGRREVGFGNANALARLAPAAGPTESSKTHAARVTAASPEPASPPGDLPRILQLSL